MAVNFQFAFFGSQHNYLARVMRISGDGIPQEDSLTELYGLPDSFASQFMAKSYVKRFLFNIRGHDFLSYGGQWTSKHGSGYLETVGDPISESSILESVRDENKRRGHLGLEMTVSFGSTPGSFFVDAFLLRRYKWANLPLELEDSIQRSICVRGYGSGEVREMSINSNGGWVVLLDKGKRFEFGGLLPLELSTVLQDKQKRKLKQPKLDISISRIYMNHQHPLEYVLLFQNGECFASLHNSFEDPLKRLLTKWATGNGLKGFSFIFKPSCSCSDACQKRLNASYYARRGLFQLSRYNVDLALKYFREASFLERNNMQIRDEFAMALIAMRRTKKDDQILNDRIADHSSGTNRYRQPPPSIEHQDESTIFRDEYMWMLGEGLDITVLERRLDELQRPFSASNGKFAVDGTANEWSYDKVVDTEEVHEIGSPVDERVSIYTVSTTQTPAEIDGGGLEITPTRTISHEMPTGGRKDESQEIVANSKSLNQLKNAQRSTIRSRNPLRKIF